jgi:hypothetical protein
MKYRLVEAERAEHSISRLCKVIGVTTAGYYAWRSRKPSRRELADRRLERLIGDVFRDSRETYGAPRVHAERQEALRAADASARSARRVPPRQAAPHDDARCRRGAGARPRPAPLRRRAPGRAVAGRHHLSAHLRGLALPRRRDGRLQPQDRRLVDARGPAGGAGRRRARHGGDAPPPASRARPPLRSRLAAQTQPVVATLCG